MTDAEWLKETVRRFGLVSVHFNFVQVETISSFIELATAV